MKKAERQQLKDLTISQNELHKKFYDSNLNVVFANLKQESASILDKVYCPDFPSQGALSLIMLFLFKGKLLHKDDIARVGSQYLNRDQTDWQVRHLSTQGGFFILGKGDLIPGTNLTCPSGYHMLITLDGVSPKFAAVKRIELLNEGDFDKVKLVFDNRCCHCGSKEGDSNFRDGAITKLQKGHIDPNKSLDIGNILPICDYCNRTYKDTYILLRNGAIDRINIESERIARLIISKAVSIHGKSKIANWL